MSRHIRSLPVRACAPCQLVEQSIDAEAVMITRRTLLAGVASGLAAPGLVRAQSYPARPIKLIVPFAAGGPADVMARVAGQRMSAILGQNLIVENRPGAGGTIG